MHGKAPDGKRTTLTISGTALELKKRGIHVHFKWPKPTGLPDQFEVTVDPVNGTIGGTTGTRGSARITVTVCKKSVNLLAIPVPKKVSIFDGVYAGTFSGMILHNPLQSLPGSPPSDVYGDLMFSVIDGIAYLGDVGAAVGLDGGFSTLNDVTTGALVAAQLVGQFQEVAGGGVMAKGWWYVDDPNAPGVGDWKVERITPLLA
jgi:hypothetical protein